MNKIELYSKAKVKQYQSNWDAEADVGFANESIMDAAAERLAEDPDWRGDGLELAQYVSESNGFTRELVPSIKISTSGNMFKATVLVNGPVTIDLVEKVKDYISGQYSDGWGEGFEQREVSSDTDYDVDYEEYYDEEAEETVREEVQVEVQMDTYVSPWWSNFSFEKVDITEN